MQIIEDLVVLDATIALDLAVVSGMTGFNTVRGNLFENASASSGTTVVRVSSADNTVQANRISSTATAGGSGLLVTGERCTVAMNVIDGDYLVGLLLSGIGTSSSVADRGSVCSKPTDSL